MLFSIVHAELHLGRMLRESTAVLYSYFVYLEISPKAGTYDFMERISVGAFEHKEKVSVQFRDYRRAFID